MGCVNSILQEEDVYTRTAIGALAAKNYKVFLGIMNEAFIHKIIPSRVVWDAVCFLSLTCPVDKYVTIVNAIHKVLPLSSSLERSSVQMLLWMNSSQKLTLSIVEGYTRVITDMKVKVRSGKKGKTHEEVQYKEEMKKEWKNVGVYETKSFSLLSVPLPDKLHEWIPILLLASANSLGRETENIKFLSSILSPVEGNTKTKPVNSGGYTALLPEVTYK